VKRLALALLVGMVAPTCATIGPPYDADAVAQLREGVTTRAEVTALLGEPHQTSKPLPHESPTCVERWHYATATAVAGGRTRGDVAAVDFNASGVVCHVAYTRIR
jgi:outer membrane protein assembly factor BamE (lipoprotein component of BamABCDE complex)